MGNSSTTITEKCEYSLRKNRAYIVLGVVLLIGAFYVLHQKQIENEEILLRFERAKPTLPTEIYNDIALLRWKISQEKQKARMIEHDMITLRKVILKKELEAVSSELRELEKREIFLQLPDVKKFLPQLDTSSTLGLSSKTKIYISQQHRRNYTLAIGITITTVSRVTVLLGTLQSLINHLQENDKSNILFVVYVNIPGSEDLVIKRIMGNLKQYFHAGMIEIIVPPSNYYPPDLGSKLLEYYSTEMSPELRLASAKQVLDHSYIMSAVHTKAMFYLKLDDDVIPHRNYAQKIQDFAFKMSTVSDDDYWFELSFSTLPCIGKLYRTSDVVKLSTFFMMNYRYKDCDGLVEGFIAAVSCSLENNTCAKIVKKQRVQYRPVLFSKTSN